VNRSFVKLIRGPALDDLLENEPNAYLLGTKIATRARYCDAINDGLEIGEAWIGDHASCGLTRAEYRTALKVLKRRGIITTRTASFRKGGGTIAKLINSDIYDVTPEPGAGANSQLNRQLTTSLQPQTRRIEGYKEEEASKVKKIGPDRAEVEQYGKEKDYPEWMVQEFYEFNTGNGWPIRDWKSACDSFIRNKILRGDAPRDSASPPKRIYYRQYSEALKGVGRVREELLYLKDESERPKFQAELQAHQAVIDAYENQGKAPAEVAA
jgi:hypothetical protein